MTEWIWIKFDGGDEWQPAELRDGRYYPALESGWFDAKELWEVGPAVALPSTPDTDEREALVTAIRPHLHLGWDATASTIADAILAAGWRKP